MEKGSKYVVYLIVFISIIFWGLSYIWTNELLSQDVPILIFVPIRILLAGICMLIISLSLRKLEKIRKGDLKLFLALAFFEPLLYFIGETYGMKATNSPTLSSIIIGTIPVFTLIVGQIVFREKLSKLNKIGVILSLPGIVLFAFHKNEIGADYSYGIALLFVAVLSSICYSTVCKKLASRYNVFTITTYQFVFGALYFMVPFIIYGLPQFDPVQHLTIRVVPPIIVLALFCSCIAFGLYNRAIQILGITRASVFTSLIPIISAVAAFLVGQETFSTPQIFGLSLTVIGVIIAQLKAKK